jgi:hypothetical protein
LPNPTSEQATLQKSSQIPDDPEETGFLRRQFGRIRHGAARGWLGDWSRFWWTLIALNLSKTLYVVRGRRTRCPCQHPSDSGRAWETGCDAAAFWNSPARFRRVCPVFKRAPDGQWRCSVDAANVRPFWIRAAAWSGGFAVVLYLVCAVFAFAFLRAVGNPVRFASVAWPPDWHEIQQARASYFFQKAEAAIGANRTSEALLSLAQSYELNPHDYVTGRILAQLWQSSQSDRSSQIYAKLMVEHPAQRSETAKAWFRNLLARGDFKSVEALAWERLNAGSTDTGAWLNALMIASRQTRNEGYLVKAVKSPTLPSYVKQACAWELMAHHEPRENVMHALTAPVPADANVYLLYYRIDGLFKAGFASDALFLLDRDQARLPAADRWQLYLDGYAAMGWQSILLDQVNQFLSASSASPEAIELLCAHVIKYPDTAVLDEVADALDKSPPSKTDQKLEAYLSLYCAAGAVGDWKRLQAAGAVLKVITQGRIALDPIEGYFRSKGRLGPIERYLPGVPPIPMNVIIALYAYSDGHPPGK